ncbi:unnamed protein product [Caenorhabditis nigoni]
MKSFVFLLLAICHVAADSVIANKEEYLKELNEERRTYAKKARIPNMYKLSWDDYLVETIKTNSANCHGKTCRTVLRSPEAEANKHAQDTIKWLFADDKRTKLAEEYRDHHVNGVEDFTPGQKKIGCIGRQTVHGKDRVPKRYNQAFVWNTYCLMAPEGNSESWNVPRGEPGSACGQGYENDDGLCVPVSKSESAQKLANQKSTDTTSPLTDGASHGLLEASFVILMICRLF